VLAGTLALGGLGVLAVDAGPLFDDLVGGIGLPALLASVTAGIAALALVRSWRFEAARYSAGVAVAAIIVGWALAQQPTFLPGLTIEQAAAGDATLVATLVGLVVGLAIVVPSLFVLFRLVLRGRLDSGPPVGDGPVPATVTSAGGARGLRGATAACLLAGVALLLFGGDLANAIGALALITFCALGTVTLLQPADL
jgi:cytochrome d ubiquinol oxidase subunit II